MKFSKGSIAIIAIIGALVLIIIAGGVWYFVSNKPTACTEEAKVCPDGTTVSRIGKNCEFAECPVVADEFKDWKMYTNEVQGFEFKYPDSMSIVKNEYKNDNGLYRDYSNIELSNDDYKDFKLALIINIPAIGFGGWENYKPQSSINIDSTIGNINYLYQYGFDGNIININWRNQKQNDGYMLNVNFKQENRTQIEELVNQILSTFKFIP
ncbi:hypothetical protein KKF60_01805 [Patescibacteria group bacterium]|nr:hypothetical protein [Patescibacteria group bacterium]MBU4458615.1 hypothetical protein [Patescibacteria group bacterium]MCG2696248.1 hypothetical protein [Candidatus Portnoybacteria bacterium]